MVKLEKFRTLRWKALFVFLLLVTLPSIWIGDIVLTRFNAILLEQFEETTERSLDGVDENISEKLKTIEGISDYMIYSNDFRTFFTTPDTLATADVLRLYRESIEGFSTFQLMSKGYIKSMRLESYNGHRIDLGEPIAGSEEKWIAQAVNEEGAVIWSDSYPIVSEWKGPKRVVSMFRVIYNLNDPTEPIGRVTIRLDETEFSDMLEGGIAGGGSAFIVRENGDVLLHEDEAFIGKRLPDEELLERLANGTSSRSVFSLKQDGKSRLVFSRTIEGTDWTLVAMMEKERIVESLSSVRSSMEMMVVLLVVCGLLGLFGTHLAIIRPVLELKRQTQRLQYGDFSAEVSIQSKDEIGMLGNQFNRMVHTIRELIDKKYRLQIRQRESELKMLISQMDPHFLYNTLDMIRWTARLEKAMETSGMIELLSRFFRLGLTRGKPWATLKEEMEFTQAYVMLLQKRSGSRLKIALTMEAPLEQAVVLKRIIQPLVENSVKHGLENMQEGLVRVRCYAVDGELRIDVMDTGAGISTERASQIRYVLSGGKQDWSEEPLQGHGLANVHERLSIVFGSLYGVQVMEQEGAGAFVRLTMPLIDKEEELACKLYRESDDDPID